MPRWHLRPARKPTGGLMKSNMKRKSRQKGSKPMETKMGKAVVRIDRIRGANSKARILSADYVNVVDAKGKPLKKAKLLSVTGNPANPHYVRRNIITKGAIVKTDIGSVRITSRPGQTGSLNGVLLEEKGK